MQLAPWVLVAAGMAHSALAADRVEVRTTRLGPDRYELAIELPAQVDPRHATSMLFPVAEQLCDGRPPRLGRYRFESSAPLGAGTGAAVTQRFTQQVECNASTEVVHVTRAPKTPPTAQDEQTVRADTLAYLTARDRSDFAAAAAYLGSEMAAMDANHTARDARAAFNAAAGQPTQRDVVRLTWYDDPAGAPVPGRYVAADYRGDYAHAGFYCGYIVWLLQADGGFRIVRQEEAHVPDEVARTFTPEQRAAARAQVQCRD